MKETKNISKVILDAIDLNLIGSSNPLTYHFYENDNLWINLISFVKNEGMMRVMIFNNDKLGIAPIHTYSATLPKGDVLRNFEKNSIGRFWKFVFETLGYKNTKRVYRVNSTVRNGKLFY